MSKRRFRPHELLLAGAIFAGLGYFLADPSRIGATAYVAWKGAGVGLLALWAASNARNRRGWLIALVLALGALGDVLLDVAGQTIGGMAFLAGHIIAAALYWRNRRGTSVGATTIAFAIALLAWLLPADRSAAVGIAIYALGVGAMAGTAVFSRYPRIVAVGALMFAASDLLIFARMGPLAHSLIPPLLVWPLYFVGQLLIALGVVGAERRETRHDPHLHHRL